MFGLLRHGWRRMGALALAALVSAACEDATGTGDAQLTVQLTDAAAPIFESVRVTIGEIQIIPADGAPITLTEVAGEYDLLTLQDGVTANLATLAIEAGTYLQLRMIVSAATVTLKPDYQFTDGTREKDLMIPSGAQTGIKINLDDADGDAAACLAILPGQTILFLDFDVSQNFVIQGAIDSPAGIQGVLFTPLLRAVVRDIAASISGTVSDTGGVAVVGGTVRAKLESSGVMEALQTDEGTAQIGDGGAYSIQFLSPGTYTVTVEVDSATADPQSVTIGEAENKTGVDFVVTPSSG
jgi:hypothetical protein